jgi:hypothetical protein
MRRFGPGRPLVATAVVVGASRSAARSQVAAQAQMNAEAQRQAEAHYQRQLQEEAARDQKTQAQIQAALAEERSRSKSPMPPAQHNDQSGQSAGAIIGYCSVCGHQRTAIDKFCSRCGKMHDQVITPHLPPQYLESQNQLNDSGGFRR